MLRMIAAFLRTRHLARTLKTRADIQHWQARQLAHWETHVLPGFSFYRHAGKPPFDKLPLSDKAMLMADFAAYNRAGVTADQGWAIFEGRAPQRRGIHVGASTGTSGNRGLYVISDAERYEWLGVMLAKTLPRFPFETARIALVLPLNSSLYTAAARAPGLSLRFFDLHQGLDRLLPDIDAYGADTIIAPPKVLRALAEARSPLRLKRVFSGAEVLDPLDRAVIEAHFGVRVREIYMATEGLMGVACTHGTLHLCEDVMHFEWAPVPGSDLVSPVITDFTRTTQAMCRYRMNDLLRLSDRPCPCGSPFQAVAAIEGRSDDILTLGGQRITPDILRNAIVDADRRIQDFRLCQTGPAHLELILSAGLPADASANAATAIESLLSDLGIKASILSRQEAFQLSARKLRRIENAWKG